VSKPRGSARFVAAVDQNLLCRGSSDESDPRGTSRRSPGHPRCKWAESTGPG
jgi:hypothetical protein